MAKKQTTNTTKSPLGKQSFAVIVPNYSSLEEHDVQLIAKSGAVCVYALDSIENESETLVSLSGKDNASILSTLNDLEASNIVFWGNSTCSHHALELGKSNKENVLLVGNKGKKGKDSSGGFGRWCYELSTQLATSVNANGSFTETLVAPKESIIKYVELNESTFQETFTILCSRLAQQGENLVSEGNFSNIKVKGTAKTFIKNNLSFCKERFNYFFKQPLKELKEKTGKKGSSNPIYRLLFASLMILSLLVLPIVSQNYGMTWDEKLHATYGEDLVNYYITFGEDESITTRQEHAYTTMKYYGASFDFICAAVHKVIPSADIYALRHFINSLFGVLCILFCGYIAREFGGWRTAFIALLLILLSPSFMGHIFNNPKDIPFAAGFALGVLFLIRYFKELPNPTLKTKVMLSFGIAFPLSIRPPGLILIAFFAFILFVHWVVMLTTEEKKKLFVKYLFSFVSISIIGYLLGILLWPFALEDPINNPLTALKELSNFSLLTYYELFEGVRQYIKPWYYIPKTIAITAPLVALIGMILGLVAFIKMNGKKQKIVFGLLLFMTIFPLAYSIYKDSYLYNGWRHFLFIYIPLISLSAIGFEFILKLVKGKVGNYILYGILALGLGKVFLWQLGNHPYEYLYHNELVGGVEGAAGDFETDYWCQTPRAAMEWLVANEIKGDKKIRVKTNNEHKSLQHIANGLTDSIQVVWSREYEWHKEQWDYAIWTSRTLSKNQIEDGYWPPKGTIHTVDVDGFPIAAVVKRENEYTKNGLEALSNNRFEMAEIEFKKAIEYDPKEEEALRGLAIAYKSTNRYKEAHTYFKRALEERDGNYEALAGLGEVSMFLADLEKQKGNAPKAAEYVNNAKWYFQETIKHKINYSTAYYYLATTYFNEGDYFTSIKYFDQLLERRADIPQAHLMKAKAQLSLNDLKGAETTLLFAIQNVGLKNQELFIMLADVFRRQGNEQAAQQVMAQMPK